jgi:hypothetical protein
MGNILTVSQKDEKWVGGNAWFGSMMSVVETYTRKKVHSTFIIENNQAFFPMRLFIQCSRQGLGAALLVIGLFFRLQLRMSRYLLLYMHGVKEVTHTFFRRVGKQHHTSRGMCPTTRMILAMSYTKQSTILQFVILFMSICR